MSPLSVKSAGRDGGAKLGLALGLGGEYALTDAWTARAELGLYGFGEEDRSIAGAPRDIGLGASVLRVGVTRKF